MEETIKVNCPECGKEFKIPAAHNGKKAKCSKCSKIFTVTLPVTAETLVNLEASQPEPQEDSSNSESKQPLTKAEIDRRNAIAQKISDEHAAKWLNDKKPEPLTITEKLANFFIFIGGIEIIAGFFCLVNGSGSEDISLMIIGGGLLGNSLGLFAIAAILYSLSTIVLELKKLTKKV